MIVQFLDKHGSELKSEFQIPTVINDLPGGAKRLKQYSTGIMATIVAGKTVLMNNQHTGALQGQFLRGPLARS